LRTARFRQPHRGQGSRPVGVCQNTLDPYRPSQWQTAPTPAEILAALPYLAWPYTSIPDVETLKAVIASQYVASIGIDVYQSFESDEAAATGNIPYIGGHEVTTYAFDDNHVNWDEWKGAVHSLNGWVIGWGGKVTFNTEDLGFNTWTQRLAA
jgi:hypothetical protein